MILNFLEYIKENSNIRNYKNFDIIRNDNIMNGAYGKWEIPNLYHREYGNKISKGFKTVSLIQAKEAIDKWLDLNNELESFK